MDMAPRLLLTEELKARWQGNREAGELNRELVGSAEWLELTQHPRLKVYETGRLDDSFLGGEVDYGKLHAKYMISDKMGFFLEPAYLYADRMVRSAHCNLAVILGLALGHTIGRGRKERTVHQLDQWNLRERVRRIGLGKCDSFQRCKRQRDVFAVDADGEIAILDRLLPGYAR